MDKLITIANFKSSFEANLIKVKLNAAGIESMLTNDYIITLQPLDSKITGGINLKVLESDVADAMLIINDES